ncbi:MAG: PAS domain-containing sensor histidine kinase [Ignavibacteriales bacterium]|nr:PAS domain-containing sensor histidine kinase [Ignavibacteriales bacterium]
MEILDQLSIATFIIDETGKIIYLNKAACSFIGNTKEKCLSKDFFTFIQDKNSLQSILKNPDPKSLPQTIEIRFNRINGKSFYTILSINNYLNTETQQNQFIISLVDLTNQKMQVELIKENQLRFENIANSAPVMIWITDVNGLFNFVNQIWCDFTGRTIGDELGLNWVQDIHPEDLKLFMEIYSQALENRTPFSHQFRFKRNDGIYRWLMISGIHRFNDQKDFLGLIGTCIDITKQKENEEYIKKINDELESATKNKDKFFSIISHDLRSPLSGIMTLLDIMVTDYDSLEEDEKKEILFEAAKTSKSTFTLMENLLEWSRVQTGNMNFEPQNISLTLVLNNIKNLYSQKLKEKGISLNFEFETEFFAYVDLPITETILRNLISNAIKFTPEFGIILVSFENVDDNIVVKIKDTGVGIDTAQISKLFKLDISYSTVGTAGERGTGLGLILCKELVEKQGGKIWIESEVGSGSTFFFTLPRAK